MPMAVFSDEEVEEETARSTPTLPHIHFDTVENRWLEPTEPPIEEKSKKTLHCCWNCVGRKNPTLLLEQSWVLKAQSFLRCQLTRYELYLSLLLFLVSS
ncbi:hypothetical protein JHK85_032151 [Glycine max]|nr:hypothetical protein JHK85_032151 [Glycine max]KAG4994757.1 hypothetical protein JHK86_031584 [Glycine max]